MALCIYGVIYCSRQIHKCNIELKRSEAVCDFRIYILYAHYDLYHKLPDYDSMVEDTKPLTIEDYFPEYKIKPNDSSLLS